MTNTTNINTRKILFTTSGEYLTFSHFWKTLSKNKEATALDHMIHALIQGTPLDHAFTPIKNKTKLECQYGGDKYMSIKQLIGKLSYILQYNQKGFFDGKWKDALPANVIQALKTIIANNKATEDFIIGRYTAPKLSDLPPEEVKETKTGIKGFVKTLMGAK